MTDTQSVGVHLVIPWPRRSEVQPTRMSDLWLDVIRHGPGHDSRHFQPIQGGPQAVLDHLWGKYIERRGVDRHVRVSTLALIDYRTLLSSA